MNVNLYTEEINDVVIQRGHWAEWERAAVCSCVTRDTGQPNFNCKICNGTGFRYLQPKRIKVAVTSLNSQLSLETLGFREPGTAYATPTDDCIFGFRDRLRFPDFKCVFSEVIKWEEGLTSPKTCKIIKEILFLADEDYEYELGVDFEISNDRRHIKWLNEDYKDTLKNKNISLLYYTEPSYLVQDLLHELRATLSDRKTTDFTFRELPKQYLIKREDFIYNVDSTDEIEETNEIEYDEDGGITI